MLGSMVDSLLGACFQFSGYCSERRKVVSKPGVSVRRISGAALLSNEGVNALSAVVTSVLTATLAVFLFR